MLAMQDREFQMLVSYIRDHFGINLEKKKNLIEGRLGNHVLDIGFESFQDYFDHVRADSSGIELSNLANRLTTNHTYFMREPEHFNFLKRHVLPDLSTRLSSHDIRTWSAGCSSGEEPYTLAMVMRDYFSYNIKNWDTTILATDISSKALKTAREAQYSEESLEILPETWRKRFFCRVDAGKYKVDDKVRESVIFRVFNLMQEQFPFKSKFHIIFCRNVMIYFDKPTKMSLVERYYDATEPGGYLMIGHAETISKYETRYEYVQPAIYRKPL